MLSYKVENNKVTDLKAAGSFADLLGETSFLIRAIYNTMATSDKEAAKAFQAHFALMAADPESPMWENSNPNCISIVRRVKPKESKSDDK